ncbi:hypothetical protein ABTN08_19645, partial [Acinetobacter baumannii]
SNSKESLPGSNKNLLVHPIPMVVGENKIFTGKHKFNGVAVKEAMGLDRTVIFLLTTLVSHLENAFNVMV